MVYRKKPEHLTNPTPLLDAMGRFRKVLIDHGDKVRPFGVTYKAIELVRIGVDGLAHHITGVPEYFSAIGSTPVPGAKRWRDSGS